MSMRQTMIRHVEGNLPVRLDVWSKARRGYRIGPAKDLDLGVLDVVAGAPLADLRDPQALAVIVEACGLSDDRPAYFPERYGPSLGRGLRMWQSPPQLAAYLCEVARHDVHTYLEVGAQHGGTFLFTAAYLDRVGGLVRADAVDLTVPRWQSVPIGVAVAQAHRMDSMSMRFRRLVRRLAPVDLALIDGDHTAVGCMRDFRAVEPHARLIAFHDISDHENWEVHRVWEELQATHADAWDFHAFQQQDPDVVRAVGHELLGIGLMVRRAPGAASA